MCLKSVSPIIQGVKEGQTRVTDPHSSGKQLSTADTFDTEIYAERKHVI